MRSLILPLSFWYANNWGASVFLQIIDPEAFGGRQSFVTETEYLAEKCSAALTRPDDPPVQLPGRRALKLRQEQLHNGVRLYPAILPAVKKCAEKYGVAFLKPMASE
jgi:LDH2 family malate/lactate/ureidoglycolate dehydrogenase